jgi:carotenoid cleavage dioxygenase-like enzyme
MDVNVVGRMLSTLPADDDHPYRTGAWTPQMTEFDVDDCDVVGEIPADLAGIYLRNTENPVHPAIGRYHPFDGDGMLHMMRFRDGKASYRNRFVRTEGLAAENEAGGPLWAGILEPAARSIAQRGWGARTRMKDASSTDVVVHAGRAFTSFYQCGDLYAFDPATLEQHGPESWSGRFPKAWGISAHQKVDENTGEMLVFNYATEAPYMHYGVVDANHELCHWIDVPLPGPRLPHDMAFTEHYAILNDFPLFWDASFLEQGLNVPKLRDDLPSRFAIVPRRGSVGDIRWFEADPTYVLHWANAFEDGDEVVLDGYYQGAPIPAARDDDTDKMKRAFRGIDTYRMETRLHRWRFDLASGTTKEEVLSDRIMEFPMINARHAGRPYRYVYNMTTEPGWFLFDGIVKLDLETGVEERYAFGPGVFGSETPMAPRVGAQHEDDGYLVTFITDMNEDRSECWVFEAARLTDGPIARVALPERISSGTHACWAPSL